ncbi:MAG: tRNA (adenosine(37)-N6)-threonylcarbamoyltransferase complex transferase subunit TsaD [Bacteroidota bacterium]
MIILGIETSCDETSAAVVEARTVRSNVISSQLAHRRYGGVVPELASRAHQRLIIDVVDEALRRGGTAREDLDGVAATQGPGLVGALLVGLNFAKALAYALERPFIGVNHMEGHLYSNFLTEPAPSFPLVSLIVSGGHTMLVHLRGPLDHTLLGQTRDDAAGEAFDKVAKMLGLGYPGGPSIERLAEQGDPEAIRFPRSYLEDGSLDFSFSGIKTAVLYYLRKEGVGELGAAHTAWSERRLADVCASFQAAILDVLVAKTLEAARRTTVREIAIAGGVSANGALRRRLSAAASGLGCSVFTPPLEYCMDNGAMIAYAGSLRLNRGMTSPATLPADAGLSL